MTHAPTNEYTLIGLEKGGGRTSSHNVFASPWRLIMGFIFCLSFVINILFSVQLKLIQLHPKGVSRFAKLSEDTYVPYHYKTKFSGDNDTDTDKEWDTLVTDPIAIPLSDEFARQNGLLDAARFPWDSGKGLYYIRGFHDLHCLKLLRRSIVEYRRESSQTIQTDHINHCLDTLRQSIMCTASDLPMRSIEGYADHTGDGQLMQCRSWEKLSSWATHPDREACFRTLDEYRPVVHGLERFAFCPKESPYFERMVTYFRTWGHKNAFE